VEEAPDDRQSPHRWGARQVAFGVLAALAVAAVLSYALSRPQSRAEHVAAVSVKKDSACRPLREAESALRKGDVVALRRWIHGAIRVAVASLKRDDLAFGPSERIALRLDSFPLKDPLPQLEQARLTEQLKDALAGCKPIDS
jgi:hypothetical protein